MNVGVYKVHMSDTCLCRIKKYVLVRPGASESLI